MITITLSVNPANDEEAALVRSAFTTMLQSLAFKGISVSLSANAYDEDEEGQPEEPGE